MQINRFTKIVIFVTSFGFTFFSCIALFLFVSFAFRFIVLLLLLECAWGFRSCGSDEDAVPRPCKPLKRLDRNFKCFGAVTFVWLIGLCAMLRPRRKRFLQLTANLRPLPPKKIKIKEALIKYPRKLTFLMPKQGRFARTAEFILYYGYDTVYCVK